MKPTNDRSDTHTFSGSAFFYSQSPDGSRTTHNERPLKRLHLNDHGVKLVGIDTPYTDPAKSEQLESHRAIAERDMAILGGLTLRGVPDGVYTLLALPLKLEGADAAPVRAAMIVA